MITRHPTFGQNIRHLRLECGLTIRDMAEEIGVGVAALTRWELGEREPSLSTAVALAAAFGVTVDALLGPTPPER